MFGFNGPEDGSADRYEARLARFDAADEPRRRHHFWWLVHNCVAHPLIGLVPVKAFFDFHDWTARRINEPSRSASQSEGGTA